MTISRDNLAADLPEVHALPIRVRNGAAMFLAAASGAMLVGLVCGCFLGALLVLHAPTFAPAVPLVALAVAFCAAGWQARASRRAAKAALAGAVPGG